MNMPIERHPAFHELVEGALAEKKDSWSIVMDTDCGQVWVEHRWQHMNTYNGNTSSKGEKLLSVDEFRKTNEGWRLRKELEAALKEAEKKHEDALRDVGIDPEAAKPDARLA